MFLTHNYTGYPMVKEAREPVRSRKLGKILKIVPEYPQGWRETRFLLFVDAGIVFFECGETEMIETQ